MKNSSGSAPKPKNAAIDSFRQSRPKGFMRNRFLAASIDFMIIVLLCWLAFTLLGAPDWGRYLQMQDAVRGLAASDPLVLERMKAYQECFIVTLAIGAVYEALMLVIFKASAGKLILGLRVVRARDGGNFYAGKLLAVWRAVLKAMSIYLLSALPFVFMCLTAFGNPEGRSGFDLFAGTKVIDVRSAGK